MTELRQTRNEHSEMGVWVYFERKEGQCGAEKIVGI